MSIWPVYTQLTTASLMCCCLTTQAHCAFIFFQQFCFLLIIVVSVIIRCYSHSRVHAQAQRIQCIVALVASPHIIHWICEWVNGIHITQEHKHICSGSGAHRTTLNNVPYVQQVQHGHGSMWWCAYTNLTNRAVLRTYTFIIHIRRRSSIVQMTLENSMSFVSSFSHQNEVSKQTDVFPPRTPTKRLTHSWLLFLNLLKNKHTISSCEPIWTHWNKFGCYFKTVTISSDPPKIHRNHTFAHSGTRCDV